MTTSDTFHLYTPEVLEDPYPTYARLRETDAAVQDADTDSWLLTRYADVYGVLRDHETYSSADGVSPGVRARGSIVTSDPPLHTRLRSVVNRAFTPRIIRKLEPAMATVVDDLLDGTAREVDVVDGLTAPLPVIVIARMLGIPESERERFKAWSDAVVGITDRGITDAALARFIEMGTYFGEVIEQRRTEPMDDLISTVATAVVDGESLTEREIQGFCVILLVAGNETTTNLLSNLLNVLARRPDLWEALRSDRSLVEPAIEETLRYDSPVQMLWRTTTRPVIIGDIEIDEGERVMAVFAAANRDPDEFSEPDNFRLDRELNRHVAFGQGIHYCLGAPLARVEARIAMDGLLDRFANIAPGTASPERPESYLLRGFTSLPIQLTP